MNEYEFFSSCSRVSSFPLASDSTTTVLANGPPPIEKKVEPLRTILSVGVGVGVGDGLGLGLGDGEGVGVGVGGGVGVGVGGGSLPNTALITTSTFAPGSAPFVPLPFNGLFAAK